MHARYNCFSDLTFNFHSLFSNLNSECSVLVTVAIFICTWTLKLSFWFSQTFNHLMHVSDFMIIILSKVIICLSVALWLSKWINLNFKSLNWTVFFFAYVKAIFAVFFKIFAFFLDWSRRIELRNFVTQVESSWNVEIENSNRVVKLNSTTRLKNSIRLDK
jgi:hypothetical protein